jgi:hypothetical protein
MIQNLKQLDSFFGQKDLGHFMQLYDYLSLKLFTEKDMAIPASKLAFLQQKGLAQRPNNEENKYSFLDYIWIRILSELHTSGASEESLFYLKEDLFTMVPFEAVLDAFKSNLENIKGALKLPDEEFNQLTQSMNLLENNETCKCSYFLLLALETILNKVSFSIVLFEDGSWLPWFEGKKDFYLEEDIQRKNSERHHDVSVVSILKDFLYNRGVQFQKAGNPLSNLNAEKAGTDLSIENVRRFKGFEYVTEREAQNIIDTLREFSLITYHIYQKIKSKNHSHE